MTATTPIERVADVLELAQFRRMPTPIQIAGLDINAPAAFVAKSPSPDLVVIGDTVSQTPRELQQLVEGAGRADTGQDEWANIKETGNHSNTAFF